MRLKIKIDNCKLFAQLILQQERIDKALGSQLDVVRLPGGGGHSEYWIRIRVRVRVIFGLANPF